MTTRILLVDDHPLVREGLRARLSVVPGLAVVGEAGDAAQALEQLESSRPDLVLMDVGMKQVDGIQLTARLLERRPGLHVLMLSMYDNPEYVNRALRAGARGYVLKEAPSEEIVAAIASVGAGQVFLSPQLAGRAARSGQARPLLSARESEILGCLARGQSSKQIGEQLGMSVRTVETHRHNIRRKLNLGGQAELIKYAVERCAQPDAGIA
jgi:DNA-binding NarL/FixJ family response regulator